MSKKTKVIVTTVSVWLVLSIVASFSGFGFALFGYGVSHSYYSQDQEKKIDSTRINLIIYESRKEAAAIPVFGFFSEGAPFSIGLMAVDYENTANLNALELVNLEVIHKGQTFELLSQNESVSDTFETYVDGLSSVKAECMYKLAQLSIDVNEPIHIEATFILHGDASKKSLQETISAEFTPSLWKGFWRIWDGLSA